MDVIKKKHWWQSDTLKWSVMGLLGLLVGYLVQGEYLFAIMTLILSSAGLYIFANRKAYAWRYVYPGVAGMGLVLIRRVKPTILACIRRVMSGNWPSPTVKPARITFLTPLNLAASRNCN